MSDPAGPPAKPPAGPHTTDPTLPAVAPPAAAPPTAAAPATPMAATLAAAAAVTTAPASPTDEPPIRLRPLGSTGLDVAELALGTWGLSGDGYGPVSNRDAEGTVRKAVELGVTLFETSDAYARGGTESLLGRLLEPHKETTLIATRHGIDRSERPARKRFDPAYLRPAIDRSCERLRRESIDIYLLHNPVAETLRSDELRAFLRDLKQSSKVRAWGVACGSADVARAAIAAGADVIELAYNAFHAADLASIASEVAEARVGVLARSVLAYGLLAGLWPVTKMFAEGDHRRQRWVDSDELATRIRQLDALRSLQGGEVTSLRGAAVRYVLSNHLVSSAVLGPRNVLQLVQLVQESGKGPPYLDDDKLARLPVRLAEAGIDSW